MTNDIASVVPPAAPLRTPRLTLNAFSLDDARRLQDGHPPYDPYPGYDIAQLRMSAGGLLQYPATRTVFWIEHGEHDLIGFIAVDWDARRANHAFISFIEIAEELQDKRYGREALEAVMKWAAERGARELTAEIPPDNMRSRRLFERLGFRREAAPVIPGAIERWRWNAVATGAERVRKTLNLHWSTAVNHEDLLRDIEPFYRPLAEFDSHRLVRLVEAVRADRDAVREQRATVSLPELLELRHVANTFQKWSAHPIGKKVVAVIRDSNKYAHNVVVLTAYSFLHNWGNSVIELVEEDQSLMLVSSALERQLEKRPTRTNIAGAIALTVGRPLEDIRPLTVPRDRPAASIWEQLGATLNPDLLRIGIASRNAHNQKYAGPVRVLRFRDSGPGLVLP